MARADSNLDVSDDEFDQFFQYIHNPLDSEAESNDSSGIDDELPPLDENDTVPEVTLPEVSDCFYILYFSAIQKLLYYECVDNFL